jgi:hypothetical protein
MDLSQAKAIEIQDKHLFDHYFRKYSPEISELTFTNLFMWRDYYEFRFIEWKNHLLIFSHTFLKKHKKPLTDRSNVLFFLPPIGERPSNIIIDIINELNNVEFHRVPENITDKLKNEMAKNNLKIEVLEDRNNWDYCYEKDSIMNLVGNKHRQNRRWLQKFLDNYNCKFHLLTADWIDKSRELQLEWCVIKGCDENETLTEEQKAINYALTNFDKLNFNGGILCVDNKCVAYTFGEMLNSNTLVIHIEKAHNEYEGSYQAINNLFLKNYNENVEYVNREQDLGIEGLRRAKESYKPYRMIKKSVIYPKQI